MATSSPRKRNETPRNSALKSSSAKHEQERSYTNEDGVRITEIPMKKPEYGSKPKGRTLLDLIDEKRPRDANGTPIGWSEDGLEEVEPFGPVMNTLIFAIPLMILLCSLDIVVHMQYRQDLEWSLILWRCIKAFPGTI
jgi:hypothetical protein